MFFSFPPVSQYGINEGTLRRKLRPHLRQQQQQRLRQRQPHRRQHQLPQQQQQHQQLRSHEMPLSNFEKFQLFLTIVANNKNKNFQFLAF